MIRLPALLLLTGLLTAGSAPAVQPAEKPGPSDKAEGIELDARGTVTTGLIVIGGETTGVALATSGGFTCELAGKIDEKLNGKTCRVRGTLLVKAGVEVRVRTILTVKSIEAIEAKPEDLTAQATILGTVKTGVVAPGGATTGVTITAAGATWELDIKDKELLAVAVKCNGKLVKTTGRVEVKRSPAAPPRPRTIVLVNTLESIEK